MRATVFVGTLKYNYQESTTWYITQLALERFDELGVSYDLFPLSHMYIPASSDDEVDDPKDEFPLILESVKSNDILLVTTPVWFGQPSSLIAKVLNERMNGWDDNMLENGYITYNKTAGMLITGGSDGCEAVAKNLYLTLNFYGFCIPPHASGYWVPGVDHDYEKQTGLEALMESETAKESARMVAENLVNTAKLIVDLKPSATADSPN